jgi:hypothetical protein
MVLEKGDGHTTGSSCPMQNGEQKYVAFRVNRKGLTFSGMLERDY